MWSDNKKINLSVNLLVFMAALNVFHIGQFLLIPISLILFFDNNRKFKVNNIKIFILLMILAIVFYLFSYQLGFYSLIAFIFPVSYYIGSNIKYPTFDNIKKLIYIISLGMMILLLLDFAYDLNYRGLDVFTTQNHFDFWLQQKVSSTYISSNYVFPIAMLYFLLIYEQDKRIKFIFIFLYILVMIYEIGLGRRTPLFLLLINMITLLFIDNKKIKKVYYIVFILIVIIILISVILVPSFRNAILSTKLIKKFAEYGLTSGRLSIVIDSIPLLFKYPFGGKLISSIVGDLHNLWLDVYDYSGCIPFALLLIYNFYLIKNLAPLRKEIKRNKTLLYSIIECILIQCCLEPMISGLSLLLSFFIVVLTVIDKYLNNEPVHPNFINDKFVKKNK